MSHKQYGKTNSIKRKSSDIGRDCDNRKSPMTLAEAITKVSECRENWRKYKPCCANCSSNGCIMNAFLSRDGSVITNEMEMITNAAEFLIERREKTRIKTKKEKEQWLLQSLTAMCDDLTSSAYKFSWVVRSEKFKREIALCKISWSWVHEVSQNSINEAVKSLKKVNASSAKAAFVDIEQPTSISSVEKYGDSTYHDFS